MEPYWITAFLDLAPGSAAAGIGFWAAVSGFTPSDPRGAAGEFGTLLPPGGAAHLKTQRLADGADRIHLDLHVPDPGAAAERAVAAGASEDVRADGYVVLRSPGGFVFCFVDHPGGVPAPPARWPGGHVSAVDQVCIDIPSAHFDRECAFWQRITGLPMRASAHEEFRVLERPEGHAVRLLLQRLGDTDGPVRAHLDLAATDRAAETVRHVSLGAVVREECAWWTVLVDPTGRTYCITDRVPAGAE